MTERTSQDTLWGLASSALVIVGSIGPWVSLGMIHASGTDSTDGIVTLILGLICGLLVITGKTPVIATITGVVALAIGIYNANDISGRGNGIVDPSVGWGLWVLIVGAISMLVWGLVIGRRETKAMGQ
jgi:hypothetical protein